MNPRQYFSVLSGQVPYSEKNYGPAWSRNPFCPVHTVSYIPFCLADDEPCEQCRLMFVQWYT
ncbi:hypothetical protein [Prevotellamassilia timonensis]|uniref:hypothetical protein n=1 Tax=Prevotellamassilia timonensis TaxID=1852370 RepID=UPI00307922B6